MDNPFNNLELKRWQFMALVLSFIVFLYSLAFDVKILNNEIVASLSLGVFFIALSHYARLKKQTPISTHNSIKIKTKLIKTTPYWVLLITGFALVVLGIYLIIQR